MMAMPANKKYWPEAPEEASCSVNVPGISHGYMPVIKVINVNVTISSAKINGDKAALLFNFTTSPAQQSATSARLIFPGSVERAFCQGQVNTLC